ncbi:MAG: DUF503 family protein [Planctomycetes bacterium]|nr:DUF503 family protein [Planctomycetota bacterium]
MVIGILQVELVIGDAMCLKDKRRIVMSVKEKLGQSANVAAAEVDRLDAHQVAVLGIVTVTNDGQMAQKTLDKIVEQLRSDGRFVLNDRRIEILNGY